MKNGVHHTNGRAGARVPSSMAATKPETSIVTVTPALARKWLSVNTQGNRGLNEKRVDTYAEDMRAGRWQLTHQGIAFNKTGELVDGQHRLHAVIRADVEVRMTVTVGLDVEFNSAIDQGYNRGLDVLLRQPRRWIATLRVLAMLESGQIRNQVRLTVGAAKEVDARHREAISEVWNVTGTRVHAGMVAVLAYALPIASADVLSFAEQVVTGELLERTDPAYVFRNWIGRNKRSQAQMIALASANAVRYAIQRGKLTSLYTGESGYRWICTKRRVLKLPHTPAASEVETLTGGWPGDSKRSKAADEEQPS